MTKEKPKRQTNPICGLLGIHLAALRKKAGYTQAALADKLDLDRTSVSRWEFGANFPRVENLPQIGEALGVTVDELLLPIRELGK